MPTVADPATAGLASAASVPPALSCQTIPPQIIYRLRRPTWKDSVLAAADADRPGDEPAVAPA